MNHQTRRVFGLALLLLVLAGCRDSAVTFRISEIKDLKAVAMAQAVHTPYQEKQHLALAAYFGAVVAEGVAVLEEDWRVPLLNAWVEDESLAQMCRDLFIDRVAYETILKNCRRNRFFLCADEVLAFEDAITRVVAKLSPANRRAFESTPDCSRAIVQGGS